MKKVLFLLISLCIIIHNVNAQNYVDLAKIYYQNTPENNFESTNGSTNVQEFGADLTLPIKLENGNAIVTGVSYNSVGFSLDEGTSVNLQDLTLKVGMSVNHTEKLNVSYLLLPKLSTDFKKTGGDDFQIGGVAILKYKKNENFKYKAGLYYNSDLFGPFVVPFLGCYYTSPSGKFELDLSLPIAADLNYKLSDRLKIGFNYATSTKSFNMNQDFTFDNVDYNNLYIKRYTLEAFPYVCLNISENYLFFAKVGYSVGRSYEAFEKGDENSFSILSIGFGDEPKVLNDLFDDGLIYRIGFRYRFIIK